MRNFLGRTLHQSYFVVMMCVGIILGMILGLVFRINYFASPMWIGFVVVVFLLMYFQPKLVFVGVALVAGMILAFFRVSSELTGEAYIRQLYGQTVTVAGVVDGDPEMDKDSTKIKLTNLKFGEEGVPTSGSIYISVRHNSEVARADIIIINGKLAEGFGIYAGYMYKPNIERILKPEPGDLVLKLRNWFAERIKRIVPDPQVNLGLSYLLGMKVGLPDDLSENLRIVGLVHIVVASGAHLSILVEVARRIFGKVSRFGGLLFSVLFVIFFMAMVGWTPSIMRAGIMTILTLLAWYVGRRIASWRIILLVAAITLMMNPMFLINLGWLLSFASFAGIMILGPKLTRFCYGEKKPGFIAETVITTVAATIMTLPIILYYYGTVSLVSVVANLLILPTLPYAMGLVFLVGVVAGLPGVETVVAFATIKVLDFHIAVVEFFGGMKSFLVEIEPYQLWVFGIYVVVFIPLLVSWLRNKVLDSRNKVFMLK